MDRFPVTDEEIALVGPILQRLQWANAGTKAKIQQYGVNVLPIYVYSNTPSLAEIAQSFEYAPGDAPYWNPRLFDDALFRQTLEALLPFAEEFAPEVEGDQEQATRFFWNNGQFSYNDAMAYYCLIRNERPANVLEIGSGFSTLIAAEAIAKNGSGQVHCVEPFPRPFLKTDPRVHLHAVPVQQLSAQFFNDTLRDNDLLFIDSTHTVKTGSDCLHLYLRVLPEIRRDIWVHVHDVFLPFGLPQEWLVSKQIFWTEQYLLLAFLLDNPKATVVYGSTYNARWHTDLMEALMHGRRSVGGSSLWFRYNGRTPVTSR